MLVQKMKTFSRLMVVVLVLLGQTLGNTIAYAKDKAPEWIQDISSGCKKDELCAVGYGKNLATAKADGQAGILKIFSTNISSSFREQVTSDQQQIHTSASLITRADSNGVLKGVEIQNTYTTPEGDVYVLAVLNRKKALANLVSEISETDKKMQTFLQEHSTAHQSELEELYAQREQMNSQYLFLKGKEMPKKVTYNQVLANRKIASSGAPIAIDLSGDQNNQLRDLLSKFLTTRGFRILEGNGRPAGAFKTVKGSLKMTEKYLKVSGFIKYSVTVGLTALDSHNQITGSLTTSVESTCREVSQCLDKAMTELESYFNKHLLVNLNL